MKRHSSANYNSQASGVAWKGDLSLPEEGLTAFERLQHVEGELNDDILEEVSHWFLDDDVDDLYKRHEASSLFLL